jgi:hypothetical protein
MNISARLRLLTPALLLLTLTPSLPAQQDAQAILATLVQHEDEASQHRGHYTYTSEERSDRTGGHLWVERVAETNWGKLRYLVAEDGQPLAGERLAAERARVEKEGADPEAFRRSEAARADDEQHAKQMLNLLPKAFLFDPPQPEPAPDADYLRIHFRPNPAYSPQSLEERVLHGMSGSVLIDRQTIRLHGIEGRMPEDITVGFGLATIKAGSNFSTVREHVGDSDWKTQTLHTDINGRALLLKTLAKKQDAKHYSFKRIPDGMTVAEAVAMVEKGE